MKTYREVKRLPTFGERFEYLKLQGQVGVSTFGYDRHVNQTLYRSCRWNSIRDQIIVRDLGCDLAVSGYEIFDRIVVHHINVLTLDDILEATDMVFSLDNLICTSFVTHQAIHYGDINRLPRLSITRRPGDHLPWMING